VRVLRSADTDWEREDTPGEVRFWKTEVKWPVLTIVGPTRRGAIGLWYVKHSGRNGSVQGSDGGTAACEVREEVFVSYPGIKERASTNSKSG